MAVHVLLVKAASTVATGAIGVVAYHGARQVVRRMPVRSAAVAATAWGLRGIRKAEEGAESARLTVSDVVAEARERIGEQVPPPPAADAGHGHSH